MPYAPGNRPTAPIGECGHPTYRDSRQCRSCYLAAKKATYVCAACAAPVKTKTSTLCRACWMKQHTATSKRPTCQRCGKLISWQSKTGREKEIPKHCRPCFNAIRKENRIVVEYERMRDYPTAKDPMQRKVRSALHVGIQLRKLLRPMPCAVCGYDRIPCHVHRLVPRKGYVMGNVVQVCPNCHGEIHRKIIPPPQPTVLDIPDSVKNARSPRKD